MTPERIEEMANTAILAAQLHVYNVYNPPIKDMGDFLEGDYGTWDDWKKVLIKIVTQAINETKDEDAEIADKHPCPFVCLNSKEEGDLCVKSIALAILASKLK